MRVPPCSPPAHASPAAARRAVRDRGLVVVLGALALPLACVSTHDPAPAPPVTAPAPTTSEPAPVVFSSSPVAHTLTVLHYSDSESAILPGVDGAGAGDGEGGIARFATLAAALSRQSPGISLVLAAGDTLLPAPELKLDVDGENAVLAATHRIGPRATALGNHEFDHGEGFLADIVGKSRFPYLSATIDVAGGPLDALDVEPDALSPTPFVDEVPGRILPRARLCTSGAPTRDADGRMSCPGLVVGLVGATTDTLRQISSLPDHIHVVDGIPAMRDAIQVHVDALRDEGVTVVVLLSHLQGVGKELALIDAGLAGVDVVLAGGGDNRLADRGDRLLPGHAPDPGCASERDACYPLVRADRDGAPVLVVATDGQLQYLGQLTAHFDERGIITSFDPGSRPWPADETSLLELRQSPDPAALAFESTVRDRLAPLRAPIAESAVFLDGTRETVRNRESNLGNLSADAMAWAARDAGAPVAFALRNGGGIRAPIGTTDPATAARRGGTIRKIDIQASLRFDNPLVIVETTHQALKETLESALREAGTTRGHFPQVSGEIHLEYARGPDAVYEIVDGKIVGISCPGARVRRLEIRSSEGTRVVVEDGVVTDPTRTVRFVTLDYLAKGGDGYFPGHPPTAAPLTTRDGAAVSEQSALERFVTDLVARRAWDEGRAYAEVTPGRETRIVPTTSSAPAATCAP